MHYVFLFRDLVIWGWKFWIGIVAQILIIGWEKSKDFGPNRGKRDG
jgi:hypothetical protein